MDDELEIEIYVRLKGGRNAVMTIKEKIMELIELQSVKVVGWSTIDKTQKGGLW